MNLDDNIIRSMLRNAYFVTGTAYAGKSTMVRLLAEKHGGVCCGENYHIPLMDAIDAVHQPNLTYIQTMRDWQAFISRTPEEYDAWITGCSREAAQLELVRLLQLAERDVKVFVDTNIPLETLHAISSYHHVAVMLSPQWMSVERFFDREDAEKQFIYQQLQLAPDPDKAMENYRACLARINSKEHYDEYAESGFYTHVRTDDSTIEGTLAELERHFQLA